MRASTCISLTLVLSAGAGERTVSAQSAARTDRVRISINVGAQPSSITFAGSTTKAVYLENAVVGTTYGVRGGQSFDGGVIVRVVGNFGVGVAVSSFVKRQDGAVAGTIPHPFFYNTPRAIAGTAGGLERNELVTHIQAAYVISSAGKVDFALSGGPSFFSVKQGLVSDITYTEQHPYDSATFATALTTTVGASKIGFNAGADVGVRLSKNVGVGGLVRFSRTSIEFPLPGATTNVKSDAGGVQVAGGLRLFF
ncbi:MAG: hypothetical protein DMF96_08680 [Acidobacteria bacterium]|nr:MAG: hypothetical protein DMF96_08680 [Acidobacteriota bacterium]